MKLIGYWMTNLFDDEFLAPQELRQLMPPEQRETVARYLDAGRLLVQYRGHSYCRFRCGVDRNGSAELTDGEWSWPEGLAHYVRVHGTPLPGEFVEKACGSPASSDASDDDEDKLAFWLHWSTANRHPEFRRELAEARQIAERRIATETAELIARLKAQRGEKPVECAQAGCRENSLADIAFCARHAISESERYSVRLTHGRASPLLVRWNPSKPIAP